MKICICFYGVHPDITNKKNNTKKNLVPYFLRKNIYNINSTIDIFVHSWSIEKKEKIIEEYNPTKYIIEKQKNFEIPNNLKKRNDILASKTYDLNFHEVCYSLSYSIKKVVLLMNDYEIENNFQYDIVILSMMDCIWLVPLKLNTIDRTAIYNPIWGKNNENSIKENYKNVKGDWFISNSKFIKKFSTLYDNLYIFLENYDSMHTIFKLQQNLITNNIKYKYNDIQNHPVEADRNRGLIQHINNLKIN